MNELTGLIKGNVAFIRQGIGLLGSIDRGLYNKTAPPVYDSSIGAHIRHIYDHYRQFVLGVASGHVDYDGRERDLHIETDCAHAVACLEQIIGQLTDIASSSQRAIDVSMNCGSKTNCPAQSTLARELQFLVSHTVHHYALIALILRTEGVATPSGFGVSPSTLEYQARPVPHAV